MPTEPQHPRERRDDAYFDEYWRTRNAVSIDGLPALPERAASTDR